MKMEDIKAHCAGEFVSYKQNGICKIEGTVKQNFVGLGERTYYELSPVYDPKSVIYVPMDSVELVLGMRHILTKEEIDRIIVGFEDEKMPWIDDPKERATAYSAIVEGEDRGKVLLVIKVLSLYKNKLEAEKRKLYASDAKLLNAAQKAITEEFSFVLGIEKSDVIHYILAKLGK